MYQEIGEVGGLFVFVVLSFLLGAVGVRGLFLMN